ncbi:MAG: alpha/beta hydrolase [Bryobacterales bacterium]|nr:alpha/beta hydrolase [Bryobacterales bacterium]
MKLRARACLLAFASVAVLAQERAFKPDKKIIFKDFDKDSLDLHVFLPAGWDPGDKRAAAVFFFGGGWVGGAPAQFFPHSRYLSSRGMVAISAQYRTRGSHGTTPRECVADGKAAVRWIREHAAELGVDPDRIAAGGGSAGGHVAAATGVINGLEGKGENTAVSSKPNALLLFNPVTDLSGRSGRWGEDPESGSPLQHVDAQDPPAILFHGKADRTVPFAAAEAFCDAMRAVGNRCELVGYEGRPHGFFNYGRSRASFTSTVWHMDRFLASLQYVEGEPTVGRPGDPTW